MMLIGGAYMIDILYWVISVILIGVCFYKSYGFHMIGEVGDATNFMVNGITLLIMFLVVIATGGK